MSEYVLDSSDSGQVQLAILSHPLCCKKAAIFFYS